jgi:hypothetical protein
MQIVFDPNNVDDYRTFLRIKALPVYKIRGRSAWFPDEYASLVHDGPKVRCEWTAIYGLIDPNTNQIRYIGKSIRPRQRLENHCNEKSRCHRTNWIQSLRRNGQKPRLVILAELYGQHDWRDYEKAWIAHGRQIGWPLTNGTDGGDGVVNLPPESRERIRAASIGRSPSAETRRLIGKRSSERRHSDETKQRMSRAHSGRTFTPEWRAKISAALRGRQRISSRKITDEQEAEIIRRHEAGETNRAVAADFGISDRTVWMIFSGRRCAESRMPQAVEASY